MGGVESGEGARPRLPSRDWLLRPAKGARPAAGGLLGGSGSSAPASPVPAATREPCVCTLAVTWGPCVRIPAATWGSCVRIPVATWGPCVHIPAVTWGPCVCAPVATWGPPQYQLCSPRKGTTCSRSLAAGSLPSLETKEELWGAQTDGEVRWPPRWH